MLVLARRRNEKIVFPHLGVTVEILNVAGNTVRIGIQAPPDIKILRQEVIDREGECPEPPDTVGGQPLTLAMQSRLHTVGLALQLAQRELSSGKAEQAERSLAEAVGALARLDRELALARQASATPSQRILRRALLVEDNPNEQRLLAKYLERSGFSVDVADDGCDALDYLSSHDRPDVVLLDMLMPRCDGPSTVRAIRKNEHYAGMKVFAVSGLPPQALSVPIGPEGVDHWFPKPLDPEALINEINKAVPSTEPAAPGE
jgi:carbon storage regulator CsrA